MGRLRSLAPLQGIVLPALIADENPLSRAQLLMSWPSSSGSGFGTAGHFGISSALVIHVFVLRISNDQSPLGPRTHYKLGTGDSRHNRYE
jgi:hypothetical protein